MTPGVQLGGGGDAMGQQYNTPDRVIRECGSDVIIVDRASTRRRTPLAAAKEYRARAGTRTSARCDDEKP